MKTLTKSDYEAAIEIYERFRESQSYILKDYCNAKIKELSMPELKWYRCIKPFFIYKEGNILVPTELCPVDQFPEYWQPIEPKRYRNIKPFMDLSPDTEWELKEGWPLDKLPEYFEEIKAPEPYTMQDVVEGLKDVLEDITYNAELYEKVNNMIFKAKESL